ncbi:hypothetical protein COCOBI_14-1530 [Coccomyxa sp. Obi]|nr:hypothetical protein COCOBI_14-1530 [Coccomyxa sp. Obi]
MSQIWRTLGVPSYEGSVPRTSVHRFKAGPSQPRTSFNNSAFKDRYIHLLQSPALAPTKASTPHSAAHSRQGSDLFQSYRSVNMAGTRLVLAILPLLFVAALCTDFNETSVKIAPTGSSSFNVLPVTHAEFDPMVKKVDDLYGMVLNLFQDIARMQIVVNNNNNNNLNNGANNQNNNNNNNNAQTTNTANTNNNGATAGRKF